MQFLENTFGPLVFIFTVSNLFAMGLQVRMPEVMQALKNKTSDGLIFVWGWILGPAFGYLITLILPLAEPYVIVMLPRQSRSLRTVPSADGGKGTRGHGLCRCPHPAGRGRHRGADAVDGSAADQGGDHQHLVARETTPPDHPSATHRRRADPSLRRINVATRIFPAVKKLAMLSTLLTIVWCLIIYGKGMVNTAGSMALLSMTVFMVGMGAITYLHRIRHEAIAAERHVPRNGDAQCRRRAGRRSRHSKRRSAHRGDDRHVDAVVGRARGHGSPIFAKQADAK